MDTSRYQLVDSLYGPGTVGAWLLTLCAVLISWTLNKSSRRKDSISIDFIGALLLPLIAAGHLIFQVSRLPYSVVETITSTNAEIQQYASALEAPLNICETFSMVSLLAATICGPWWDSGPKLRRLGAVLVTGLLSWGTENLMFAKATLKGVKVSDATLSRPYLFFVTPLVATTWGFIVLCVLVGGMVWITGRINVKTARKSEADLEDIRRIWSQKYNSTVSTLETSGKGVTRAQMAKLNAMDLDMTRRDAVAMKAISLMTMLFLPGSFLSAIYSMSFFSYTTTKETTVAETSQHFFLIPESNGSMSNLDQILALTGGVLVLLWTVRAAYLSRKETVAVVSSSPRRRRSI